jgi:MtN3 and saliva related transmembrane protein
LTCRTTRRTAGPTARHWGRTNELLGALRQMTGWHLIVRGLGVGAALLTSFSYVPQVRKALPRGSTGDLSLKTLIALTGGLSVWIAYGLMISDYIVACANMVGALLAGIVLACKIRDGHGKSAE